MGTAYYIYIYIHREGEREREREISYGVVLYCIILHYIAFYDIVLSPGGEEAELGPGVAALCSFHPGPHRERAGAPVLLAGEQGELAEHRLWRELRLSQVTGVANNNWLDRVLLSILHMFKPSC